MGSKIPRGKRLGNIRASGQRVYTASKSAGRSGIRNRGLGGDAGALIFDIVFDMVLSHKKITPYLGYAVASPGKECYNVLGLSS